MIRLPFPGGNKEKRDLPPDHAYVRTTILVVLGFTAVLGLAALTSFLLTLRGNEETQVPDVTQKLLVEALVDLQERDLYPLVQLRYHSDPTLKGHVISQDPPPGGIVRAGRRVTLIISQGAVIDEVADYRGRELQDVQAEMAAMGADGAETLRIGNVSYVFDEAPVGTVIEQSPEAGTEVSGATAVSLVVSRGPDVKKISLPTFLGLDWNDALQVLSRDSVPFVFRLEQQPSLGQEGVVVSQEPEPGTQVLPDTPVEVTIRSVRPIEEELRFGVFDRTLPEYAVSVELTAVAVGPEGDSVTIFHMMHPGGRVAFPYVLEVGSTIILYRYDTEVIRYVIRDEASQD